MRIQITAKQKEDLVYLCRAMKNSLIVSGIVLFIFMMACNKSNLPAPVISHNYNTDKFAGVYSGLYYQSDNGVDSNGVFKSDTSYAYSLKVEDVGNNQIVILHGPIVLPTITLDSSDHFSFADFNHNISGYFVHDSLYLSSDALNGAYDSLYFIGSWFVIQKLSFAGKRVL